MIRILVVDDSAVLRQSTRIILESDPDLSVVGEAGNGVDTIVLVSRLRPDVVTMDIRSPTMNGLEAIRQIMAVHPVPIVVVTSIDLDRDMGISAQATQYRAVSVLKRPGGMATAGYKSFAPRLIEQVKLMSSVQVMTRKFYNKPTPLEAGSETAIAPPRATHKTGILAIGSSTGGPAALHTLLRMLPSTLPVPVVIVQHISFGFADGLASWLNAASPLCVKVGQQGEKITGGIVYLAPDHHHMLIDRFGRIALSESEPVGGHRPAVAALFQSVAQSYGPAAIGVLLTGMGADGAAGIKDLRNRGAITIAQDETSSVPFRMPREAIALGAIQHIVPLDQIARKIQELIVVPGGS